MISMAGKAIRRWWALFALPTFAAFIIGFLVPFIMGVYLSFCEFTTVTDGEWIGLKNYTKALKDKEFLHALGFSTSFTIVTTIVINVIAFAIAYMLTKAIKGSTLFRSVFFMPNLIGGIILGYIWLLLLNGVLAHWGRALTYKASYGFWGFGHSGVLAANRLHDDHLYRRLAGAAHRCAGGGGRGWCQWTADHVPYHHSVDDAVYHGLLLPDRDQRFQAVRSEPRVD